MKRFDWSQEKNVKLVHERGISFEAVVARVEEGGALAVIPGKGAFAHQKQLIFEIGGYAYVVPFVEDSEKFFLKTIIPSRELTKRFLMVNDAKI